MVCGPGSGSLHESLGGSAAGEWAFLLARPPSPGHLGAVLVATAAERVAVPRQQRAGGNEVACVLATGEPQPRGPAVPGEPEPGHGGLRGAAGGAEQIALDDAAAPARHHMKRGQRALP